MFGYGANVLAATCGSFLNKINSAILALMTRKVNINVYKKVFMYFVAFKKRADYDYWTRNSHHSR